MRKKVIVVGGGPGGYVAAIRAAQLGAEVTLVEKEYLGGTCLNVGCIPTKCLLHSAKLASDMKAWGPRIGVLADNLRVEFQTVMAHKDEIVRQLTGGVRGLLQANGVRTLEGTASFKGVGALKVTRSDGSEETLESDAIILAVGSVNARPRIPGLADNPNCIDSTGALALERLPESMVVIGGGVIGLELACAYGAFGTKITVVEALDHMLPMLDDDLTAIGVRHMKRMGIQFHLECPVQALAPCETGVKVICRDREGKEIVLEAEKALVAVGRRPNTASLDLAQGGIEEERGYIRVNDRMETNVRGVYAIGDCVLGRVQLAHTASMMGEVAAENIMGHSACYEEKTCPTCVYIEPEAASVGLTEAQCRAQGLDYVVGMFPMMGNGKALILNGGEGLVKLLSRRDSGELLGMHIIGPRATDLIAEGALAIGLRAGVDDIIQTIHSHPTVTEAVREAALSAEGRAIHIPPVKGGDAAHA